MGELEEVNYLTTEDFAGIRIDKALMDMMTQDMEHDFPVISRSYLQKMMDDGMVCVNDKPVKSNYKLREADRLRVVIPEPVDLQIEPEDIPLDILYEDEDVILINKPKDMVVHPSAGHYHGTMVNALLYHCHGELSGINGVMRPGIVHRIDKDTTGVIIACKTDLAHISLSEQLKEHSITRRYYALCYNAFKELEGTVNAPIGRHPIERKKMAIQYKNGKNAVTHYKVLENLSQYAYVQCQLETGRTHQIRVHMTSIGHPLIGDTVYGNNKNPFKLQGQCLHAGVLGFQHPRAGEYMEFSAPLPKYFEDLLARFRLGMN